MVKTPQKIDEIQVKQVIMLAKGKSTGPDTGATGDSIKSLSKLFADSPLVLAIQ